MTTGCDDFFAAKATIFVGERAGAEEEAAKVAARLAGAGLAFEQIPCLQHEHLQVYHKSALYRTLQDIDRFLDYADWLWGENTITVLPKIQQVKTVSTSGRIELRDNKDAVETLTPLIGKRMRLVTRAGQPAVGNWWLGSLNAETFEVASDFGLLPPACGYDNVREPSTHVVLEVWPTGDDGVRLDCVHDKPHTTMIHVPFGHDIALHIVDDSELSDGRNRTNENLSKVFGPCG